MPQLRLWFVTVPSLLLISGFNQGIAEPSPDAVEIQGDEFTIVNKVELPSAGVDADDIQLVLHESVDGCRNTSNALVQRRGQYIRVLPRSKLIGGRCPSGDSLHRTSEVVRLGTLPKGSYRLQVITARSIVRKVLNVY